MNSFVREALFIILGERGNVACYLANYMGVPIVTIVTLPRKSTR
jgi:hypothetical protein